MEQLILRDMGVGDEQAAAVGNELLRLRDEKDGRLSVEDVVAAAVSKSNPLHGFFEWSDQQAARRFRIGQARVLIKSVTVIREIEGRQAEVPVFLRGDRADLFVTNEQAFVKVSVRQVPRDEPAAPSRPVTVIHRPRRTKPEMAREHLEEWLRRFGDLEEFAVVAREVAAFLVATHEGENA